MHFYEVGGKEDIAGAARRPYITVNRIVKPASRRWILKVFLCLLREENTLIKKIHPKRKETLHFIMNTISQLILHNFSFLFLALHKRKSNAIIKREYIFKNNFSSILLCLTL